MSTPCPARMAGQADLTILCSNSTAFAALERFHLPRIADLYVNTATISVIIGIGMALKMGLNIAITSIITVVGVLMFAVIIFSAEQVAAKPSLPSCR